MVGWDSAAPSSNLLLTQDLQRIMYTLQMWFPAASQFAHVLLTPAVIVEHRGLEPLTFSLQSYCATIAPMPHVQFLAKCFTCPLVTATQTRVFAVHRPLTINLLQGIVILTEAFCKLSDQPMAGRQFIRPNMAATVGFEPTDGITRQRISSAPS